MTRAQRIALAMRGYRPSRPRHFVSSADIDRLRQMIVRANNCAPYTVSQPCCGSPMVHTDCPTPRIILGGNYGMPCA